MSESRPKVARRAKTGGRRRGVPNQATRAFREAVADLLARNQDNLAMWLAQVAEGNPAVGRLPDPARALDLVAKLAEYAVPKMTRQVVEQSDSVVGVTSIQIEFVDAPKRDTVTLEMLVPSQTMQARTLAFDGTNSRKKHS